MNHTQVVALGQDTRIPSTAFNVSCEDVTSQSLGYREGGCATKGALSAIAQGQRTMSQNDE